MSSPRALLRTFLVQRFTTDGALERFVKDNFEDAAKEISWESAVVIQADSFIGIMAEKGQIKQVWPVLIQERSAFTEEIQTIENAWKSAAAGNVLPSITTAETTLLDRERLAEIFRAARTAKLDAIRPALFAGLPDDLLTPRAVDQPDAQLLIDLHRLNRVPGDPPPLVLWIDNVRLLLDGQPESAKLGQIAEKMTNAPVSTVQSDVAETKVTNQLENIVLMHGRPAIAVKNGTFAAPEEWKQLDDKRALIELAIAATGRLNTPEHKSGLQWAGAGVVVGDDLIAAARYMIEGSLPAKTRHTLAPGPLDSKMWFEPRQEDEGAPVKPFGFEVTEVVLCHPILHIALLRVPGLQKAGIRPLVSAAKPPRKETKIVRVTYVGQDSRVDAVLQSQVFGGRLNGAKWILPGLVTSAPRMKKTWPSPKDALLFLLPKDMLAYDSNTLGGIGGPVVSLETGEMLGYGTSRQYLKGNWAVPMWEVIRDKRVRDLGIAVPADAPKPDMPQAKSKL